MRTVEKPKEAQPKIASLDRGLECLNILAESKHPLSNGDLAKLLEVDKSTASRILSTLASHGLVEQEKESKKFVLGLRLLEYAGAVTARFNLRHQAYPFAKDLLEATNESVNIAILDGTHVIYLEKLDKPSLFNIGLHAGSRVPAHALSLGKALLASLSPEEISSLFSGKDLAAYTDNTVRSVEELLKHLQIIRDQGVATDYEEFYPGMRGIAAQIRNHDGKVIAAIGISGLCTRITAECEPEMIQHVRQAADGISRSLGWSG